MKKWLLTCACLMLSQIALGKTLVLSIAYESGLHELRSATVLERTYPPTVNEIEKDGGVRFILLNGDQEIVYKGTIDPPGILLKDHLVAQEHELAKTGIQQENTVYVVRVPYLEEMVDLQLLSVQVGIEERASAASLGQFDLRSYLSEVH
ncbi:hypothetical protein [Salinibius halmophilus]|uniref:hypothetical protein n=1 Tax=Salinibius halmophilus TaxID=1853216 RepID=UPI000E667B9D|nr:hypothetical protein [Salinibius halmophilus]